MKPTGAVAQASRMRSSISFSPSKANCSGGGGDVGVSAMRGDCPHGAVEGPQAQRPLPAARRRPRQCESAVVDARCGGRGAWFGAGCADAKPVRRSHRPPAGRRLLPARPQKCQPPEWRGRPPQESSHPADVMGFRSADLMGTMARMVVQNAADARG